MRYWRGRVIHLHSRRSRRQRLPAASVLALRRDQMLSARASDARFSLFMLSPLLERMCLFSCGGADGMSPRNSDGKQRCDFQPALLRRQASRQVVRSMANKRAFQTGKTSLSLSAGVFSSCCAVLPSRPERWFSTMALAYIAVDAALVSIGAASSVAFAPVIMASFTAARLAMLGFPQLFRITLPPSPPVNRLYA